MKHGKNVRRLVGYMPDFMGVYDDLKVFEYLEFFAAAFGKDPDFFAFYRAMLAYEVALGGEDTTLVLAPNTEFFRFFEGFADTFGRSD